MRSFSPVIFVSATFLIIGAVTLILLRVLHADWWRIRWVRNTALLMPVVGLVAIWGWGVGEYQRWSLLSFPASLLASLALVCLVGLMLSLPFSGFVKFLNWILELITRHRRANEREQIETVDNRRRVFLKATAAALPILTVGAAAKGVGWSFADTKMELRKMKFPNLPADLEGMRILQLSDLHLRHYVTLSDLETMVEQAAEFRPDLVLVTGDIADDLDQLPDALRLIDQLKPPLGTLASLGNHEYFRGIDDVYQIFESAPFPLFVNKGKTITRGNTALYVAAIDDPRSLSRPDPHFFERCIDGSLQDAPSECFSILMSHRPNALDIAATRGVDLVLAGHTHGGQIGLLGRSAFEPLWPDAYLWGEYTKGKTSMYTTSGAGHWFPFRLGCPREAPIIELVRG